MSIEINPWLKESGAHMYRCTKCSFTRCTVETTEDADVLLCPLDGKGIDADTGAPHFIEVKTP